MINRLFIGLLVFISTGCIFADQEDRHVGGIDKNEDLMTAIKKRDVREVKRILADVDAMQTKDLETAFEYASSRMKQSSQRKWWEWFLIIYCGVHLFKRDGANYWHILNTIFATLGMCYGIIGPFNRQAAAEKITRLLLTKCREKNVEIQ